MSTADAEEEIDFRLPLAGAKFRIAVKHALAIRMWPREFRPAAFKIRYAIIYAVLVVGLTIIFSVAGLIAAVVIVAISELSRSQLARRRAI